MSPFNYLLDRDPLLPLKGSMQTLSMHAEQTSSGLEDRSGLQSWAVGAWVVHPSGVHQQQTLSYNQHICWYLEKLRLMFRNFNQWFSTSYMKEKWASSHTPCSNIAWKCCTQWMPMPCISDWQSDRKLVIIGYTLSINNCYICVIFGHSLSKTHWNSFSVI